jgi:hypothetical protein
MAEFQSKQSGVRARFAAANRAASSAKVNLGFRPWRTTAAPKELCRNFLEDAILSNMRGSSMSDNRQRRGWILIAAIAIGFVLLLLLAPHCHGAAADFVAILPLLLVGIISPLSLLSPLAYAYAGRVPEAPVVAASFQRPPPFRRG